MTENVGPSYNLKPFMAVISWISWFLPSNIGTDIELAEPQKKALIVPD
jgi:hypothetical protein